MPLSKLDELKAELKRPLPGGRGFQAARDRRIHTLHEEVVKRLVIAVKDTYGHQQLAEMYLDEMFGDELGRPRIVLTDEFNEIWTDLLVDQEEGIPQLDADFKPRIDLYGLEILVYDANKDDDEATWGILREIKSAHCFVVEHPVPIGMKTWEVDSANDFQTEGEAIKLWNAF